MTNSLIGISNSSTNKMKDPLNIHSETEMKVFRYFYYFFIFIGLPLAIFIGIMLLGTGDLNFSKFTIWHYIGFFSAGAFPLTLALSRKRELEEKKKKENNPMANLNKSNIRKKKRE